MLPLLLQKFDREETLQRIIPFLVTAPLFSWIGVQAILFKKLHKCMTLDDQKASKKFVCASELARVFKSMICLFLTASFLYLNFKDDLTDPDKNHEEAAPQRDESLPLSPIELLTNSRSAHLDDAKDAGPWFFARQTFWVGCMALLCLLVTVLNLLFEAQIVINLCIEFIDEDDETFKLTNQVLL